MDLLKILKSVMQSFNSDQAQPFYFAEKLTLNQDLGIAMSRHQKPLSPRA